MRIVDSQIHVVTKHSPAWPWPHEDRSLHGWVEFTVDQVIAEMDDAGVDRAILVPPSGEGDRNSTCLEAAARHPDRLCVVGRIDLTNQALEDLLPVWLDEPGMLGLRVTFRRGSSANWLDDGTADWFWPLAEAAGIPLYVHMPGLLHHVRPIAEAHPRLRLTIDHMGMTATVTELEIPGIIDELVELADLKNVSVKASSLPSVVSDPYPFKSIHGHVKRVLEAFGPRRVFWGSDLTRLPCPYTEAVRMFTEELRFLTGEELELVMGRALEEHLGWT